MSQQIVIDSLAFARDGRTFERVLPLVAFERLHDVLVDTAGDVVCRLQGRISPQGKPQLLLFATASLALKCQRCLEQLDYPLRVEAVLELVTGAGDDLSQEDLEDDTKDFLPAQKELDVVALFEDEILLELPVAPRHQDCALPQSAEDSENASPFAVLAALKGKRS